ncbi:MAG: 3'-5' exonuclease [Candidatus Delongbacteria bacterium]|jgi:DNA helicase-2/ATP-dependent DNA helicase PcrA|nr:3'-5' exonuclease [Candidatus Delongbacteria bacterium]MDY0017786.1 3'-5' exonuclease [Candidatus Delongbacteria bacterium]
MNEELNEKQKEAAETTDGPLLIIAGAGSGKTRTLVERIVNIIRKKKASPHEILAVTFTNKAAGELRERIIGAVGEDGRSVIAGTFHSICARILRKHSELLGYNGNFVIYDSDDSEKLIKAMAKKNGLSSTAYPVKKISSIISKLKNKLIYPEDYNVESSELFDDMIRDVYSDYQKELKNCNAFDFDDLICMTVRLFRKEQDVLFEYQNLIKYICVDEYQDTNYVQDLLVFMLSGIYGNVCVVGDEDQSIYSWRGADIGNILFFKDKFKSCPVIQLERNYRSTGNILRTANAVIAKNTQRLGKNLFTESGEGEKVVLISSYSDNEEGEKVTDRIYRSVKSGTKPKNICVLYRTNSQSRIIEENLRKRDLPYTVVGGLKFYERKEIKDIIAYLRLLINPDDNISFERIINFPPRGIGKVTLEKIKNHAFRNNISYFESLRMLKDELFGSKKKDAEKKEFISIFESMEKNGADAREITEKIFVSSGLKDHYIRNSDATEDSSRIDNLYEFLNGVTEFVRSGENTTLLDFLTSVSLLSDIDQYGEDDDRIVLMTVHSAKGLEFDEVCITGLNEGLFPFTNPLEPLKTEEERRLFYVAVTRARKKLLISTYIKRSRYFGDHGMYLPSRFLEDIPEECTDRSGYTKFDEGQLRYERTGGFDIFRHKSIPEPVFERKDIVMSKQFGEGIVLDYQASGTKSTVTVDFDDFGIKKLLVRYAGLTKL